MPDVFRQGRKSVHRAIVSGDPDDPGTPSQCQFDRDPGGEWGPDKPDGPECSVCFGMVAEPAVAGDGARGGDARPRGSRPRAPQYAVAAGALALAFLGGVWASPDQGLVAVITPTASVPSTTTPSGAAPSATAGIPSQTPAPTATGTPMPDPTPLVIVERIVVIREWTTGPDASVIPAPRPTPKPCVHPGNHVGVDACRWPHN